MIKLKNIPFSEFKELVLFLGENNETYIIERISRFFAELSTEELFELNYVCSLILSKDDASENMYQVFSNSHPELDFDETGKSTPKLNMNDSWKIVLKSLDTVYLSANEQLARHDFKDDSLHKVSLQVYNGLHLENLKKIKPKGTYEINKILYFKKHPETTVLNKEKLKKAEITLKSFGLSYESLNRLIETANIKKPANWETFANHFLERLDLLNHDKALAEQSNKEFYDNLVKIK